MEHVLRNVVRDLLRTRGVSKTGMMNDLHGSRTIPLKMAKSRLSLQASSTFEMETEEIKRQKHINNIITKQQGKGDFLPPGKTNIIDNVDQPLYVNGDEPYMDEFLNPAKMRGVPGSEEEYKKSLHDRKPYFLKKLERPYYVRTEGNKSTVMDNDIFDVIYDAEQFGGSVQRHLGTASGLTRSFGVPPSADNAHHDDAHEFYKTHPAPGRGIKKLNVSSKLAMSCSLKPKRTRNIVEEDSDDEN